MLPGLQLEIVVHFAKLITQCLDLTRRKHGLPVCEVQR